MTWETFCQSLPDWLLIWARLTTGVDAVCFIVGFFTEAYKDYRQHRKKLHDEFVARMRDASNEEIEAAYRRKGIIDFAEYYREMCRRDRERMHRVMDEARRANERLKLESLLSVHQLRHAPDESQTFYANNVACLRIPPPFGTTERK